MNLFIKENNKKIISTQKWVNMLFLKQLVYNK